MIVEFNLYYTIKVSIELLSILIFLLFSIEEKYFSLWPAYQTNIDLLYFRCKTC